MKTFNKCLLPIMLFTLFFSITNPAYSENDNLIQMAILLDTSNSMDGLIEQAKSQLWRIVNEMALAKRNNKTPDLEVALYEYGKSSLPAQEGYLRVIVPLTTDLDRISDELFNLTTNGGNEFCGQVIQEATNTLNWSKDHQVLKVIFIAGNEPFTQGTVNYKNACKNAIQRGIIVNTIFCGNIQEGIRTQWKDGALLADGRYMNIDQNQKIVHIPAPQDDEIVRLGEVLNQTYISYGTKGKAYKRRQMEQDKKAASVASQVMVQRSVTKSSKLYKNKSWDLVDAVEEKEVNLENVKKEDLPKEMQNMDKKERHAYIEKMKKQREEIQVKIKKLNEERRKFVQKERKKSAQDKTLDQAIIIAVKSQAKKKNYSFEK